jgi:hypothetical protein
MTDCSWTDAVPFHHGRVQFAAGAKAVLLLYADAGYVKTFGEAKA